MSKSFYLTLTYLLLVELQIVTFCVNDVIVVVHLLTSNFGFVMECEILGLQGVVIAKFHDR
jgi:hypothetical protein